MIAELETNTGTLKREQQTTEIQRLNLGMLHASPTNPRQHFDAEALAELAESIEQHGVKMPLLARPSKTEPGKFEIVAGERRFRATTLLVSRLPERMELAGEDDGLVKRLDELMATRVEVPVIVEDLDDATVLELQLIENLQRRDLTALEEARGYQRLLDLKEKGYTPQKIAQKIGKSVDTVLNKLKMLKAPVSLQKALEEGKVGERHLVLVAGIPTEKLREECAKVVLAGHRWGDGGALSVRETVDQINEEYRASLKGVPWDLQDPELVPDAGACATCPFFAQHAAKEDKELAAELGNGRGQTDPLTCMNPKCHRSKHDAIYKRKQAEAKESGAVVIVKPKEAEKLVSDDGSLRVATHVRLDKKPSYDHTGHWDTEKYPTWRELVEDRLPAGAIHVVNTKHAGVIELVEVKTAVVAAREHKKHGKIFQKATTTGKKVLTEAEKKAKEKEAFDNKVTSRSKLVLMTYLRERAAEKGMDRDASLAVLDTVLHEAGKDGCQMMAETLAIAPREKLKNEYGVTADAYREPILAALRAQDTGKPEIDALIMLGVISKYVKAWGISFCSLKPLREFFGFDDKTIKALATAEVKAEIEAKAAKKKPEKPAAKNSTDPTRVDVAQEASKTAAADKRGKGKERRAESGETESSDDLPLSRLAKRGITVGKPGPGMLGRGPKTKGTRGKSANAKDYKAAAEKKEPNTKAGNVWDAWTPQEWKAKAAEVKAGNKKITEFIGATPDQTTPEFIAWTAARVKLYKLAKK